MKSTLTNGNGIATLVVGFVLRIGATLFPYTTLFRSRSEERRVGKECTR